MYKNKYLKYKIKYLNLLNKKKGGGSYQCPVCTFINSDSSIKCEICDTPNPNYNYKRICSECTYENDGALMSCEICETPVTFYIYTSGICDWMQNIDAHGNADGRGTSVIDMWINELCKNVLDLIPSVYTVIIEHYDPLYEIKKEDGSNYTKTEVLSKPATKIIIKRLLDNDKRNPKVRNSTFLPKELPFTEFKKPHILIDFAQLFAYPSKNTIVWLDSYMECTSGKPDVVAKGVVETVGETEVAKGVVDDEVVEKGVVDDVCVEKEETFDNIKSVNLGYKSGEFGEFNYLKFLKISSLGEVTTYIDRILKLCADPKIVFNPMYPTEFIEHIYKIIKIKAQNIARKKYPNDLSRFFDDKRNVDPKRVFTLIMNKLMDEETKSVSQILEIDPLEFFRNPHEFV